MGLAYGPKWPIYKIKIETTVMILGLLAKQTIQAVSFGWFDFVNQPLSLLAFSLTKQAKQISNKKKSSRSFYSAKISSLKRIGPHNETIISILIGNLLGDGWGEKRGGATRFHIHMSSKNMEYVYWLHKALSEKGYCSAKKPRTLKQIGSKGQIYYSIKFRTFSFSSLNYIYDMFYKKERYETLKDKNSYQNSDKRAQLSGPLIRNIKTVPANIGEFCTAKTLAIWLMDDGSVSGSGVRISTESFSLSDVTLLQTMLFQNFSIRTTIQQHKTRWILYFPKNQLPLLSKITKPYFLPCMYYKLNTKDDQR